MKTVSVRQANDVDATNAYTVTVKDDVLDETVTHTVWTGHGGKGLWIDGQQVEGLAQFNAGKDPDQAIRRYFS